MTTGENNSSSPALSANTELTTPSPSNGYFDDVFGSGPPSPSPNHENDVPVDSTGDDTATAVTSHKESLDIARLRSVHTKAGYRDGLAAAKEAALQPGFDEGYSLGAALGLQAGLIVGAFESMRDALEQDTSSETKAKFDRLVAHCQGELQRQNLLADQYIDMEGLWAWQVPVDANVHIVAASHPLIKTWRAQMESAFEAFDFSVERLDARWLDEETVNNAPLAKSNNISAPDPTISTRQIFDF